MTLNIELSQDYHGGYHAAVSGEEIGYVTADDVDLWLGSMHDVYQKISDIDGRWPTSIFKKDPTPWGEAYKQFNFDQMRYRLNPVVREF